MDVQFSRGAETLRATERRRMKEGPRFGERELRLVKLGEGGTPPQSNLMIW